MKKQIIESIDLLQYQAASLLLYQNVLQQEPGLAYLQLVQALSEYAYDDSSLKSLACLQAYGKWFKSLAQRNQNWQDYLIGQILWDHNPFSQQAQKVKLEDLPSALVAATHFDLQILHSLYKIDSKTLSQWVKAATDRSLPLLESSNHIAGSDCPLKLKLKHLENWADSIEDLAIYYQQNGTGIFAEFRALRWYGGELIGIPTPDSIDQTSLVGYESQRDVLLKNTEFFLAGYAALHVLLFGSRGSGKSSLVKSLITKYSDRGLRLIEVAKSDLKDLPTIMETLRDVPQKFILFVDDLSFEEDDDSYKALKVLLEGNLTARPPNLIIYATSNRRHLIREFYADRPRPSDADEVHAWDTMQEKLSLSDRFGLTLTFVSADQETYLKIVRHLAMEAGIKLSDEDLEFRALQWATRHNGRSGRTARQFIDFLQADLFIDKTSNPYSL